MKLEEKDKRFLDLLLIAVFLVLYFTEMSWLGVSVVVPYAFLWLVYELRRIGDRQKAQD